MLNRVAIIVISGVLLATTSARSDDVRAAIDAANAKMEADYAAGNTKAIAAAYTDEALMLPPDATRVSGHSAIEARWQNWIDAGMKNLTLKSTDVDSSGDLAYEVGEFKFQVQNPSTNAGNPWAASGNYLVVWQRGTDGVWRLKVHTWN